MEQHISLEALMDFQENIDLGSFEEPEYESVIAGTIPEEQEEEIPTPNEQPSTNTTDTPSEEEEQVVEKEEEEEVIDLTPIEQERANADQEEEEEETEEEKSQLSDFLSIFKEEGLEIDEEIEDEKQVLSEVRKQLHQQAQEDFLNNLPEDYKLAFKYAMAEGKPLSEFYHIYQNTQVDLDNVDLENESHQEYVVRSFLQKTTQFSKSRIDREIEKLRRAEMLDEEARSTFLDLQDVVKKEQKLLTKQIEEQERQSKELKKQRRDLLHSAVDSLESIDNTRKGKVKAFLTNEQWSKGQKPVTQFDKFIRSVLSNPEHIAQFADIALDYDKEKGFSFDRIAKKLKTKATTKIKKEIENEQTSTRSRKGRPASPKNIQFDWKKWAAQN
jgi:hypothetical protein